MASTIISIGSNSARIDYGNGSSDYAAISTHMRGWLPSHGWSIHDSNPGGTNRTIYKAICKDGVTNKYLDIEVGSLLKVLTWEDWNEIAHTGTNGTLFNHFSFTLNATSPGASIWLFASARYAALCHDGVAGLGDNVYGGSLGVHEISRDTEGDTGIIVPPWCIVNYALLLGVDIALSPINFPRAADGGVSPGVEDENFGSFDIGFGGMLPDAVTILKTTDFIPDGNNAWTGNPSTWDVKVGKVSAAAIWDCRGYLYGVKITSKNVGSIQPGIDKVQVNVDADGFNLQGGSLTDYWLVPGVVATNDRAIVPV